MRQSLITRLLSIVSDYTDSESLKEIETKFTNTLNNYNIEYTGQELIVYEPFPQAAKDYLVTKAIEGLSKNTLKAYKNILSTFFKDIKIPIQQIDAIVCKTWLYNTKKTGISDRTLSSYCTMLSTFFKWALDNEYIPKNPFAKIQNIKYERIQQHALSHTELTAIRDACSSLKERTIIELLYSTGCRVGEFINIKVSDIDMNTKTIQAYNFKCKHTKTVFISETCAYYLQQYLDSLPENEDVLFRISKKPFTPMTIANVEALLKKIGKKAKLPDGRLHPHILRHTIATDIVTNGGSLADAQHILDHKKVETTLIYAEMSTAQLQETHRRCSI